MNDPTPGNVYHRLEPGIAILSNLRAYLCCLKFSVPFNQPNYT